MKRMILLLLVLCLTAGCAVKGNDTKAADTPAAGDVYLEARNADQLRPDFDRAVSEWAAGLDKNFIESVSITDICTDALLMDDTRNARSAKNTDLNILITLAEGADPKAIKAKDLQESFLQSINSKGSNARLRSAAIELRDSSGNLAGLTGEFFDDPAEVPAVRQNSQFAALISLPEDELHIQTLICGFCLDIDNDYYSQNESFFGHGNFWLRRFGIEEDSPILTIQVVTLVPPLDKEKRAALEQDLPDLAKQIAELPLKDENSLRSLKSRDITEINAVLTASWSDKCKQAQYTTGIN